MPGEHNAAGRSRLIAPAPGRILLVDDDAKNLRLLEAVLSPFGHHILTADSGTDALEKIIAREPDLVLLDVMMPGMDGYQVLKNLKENAHSRDIPVVMVTSLEDTDSKVRALDQGADDFLTKPINRTELIARVHSLLKVKAYYDSLRDHRVLLEREVTRKTESLNSYSRQLEILSRATMDINARLETTAILDAALDAAVKLFGSEGGAAGEAEDGQVVFKSLLWHDVSRRVKFSCEIPLELSPDGIPVGRCCRDRYPDRICRLEGRAEGEIRRRAVLPILDRNRRMTGCLLLLNPADGFADREGIENIRIGLVNSTALALENAANLKEVREKEKALLASLREKNVLLKEVHHRVKNNLQAIVSLLEAHQSSIENPTDREVFLKGQSLAHAISMIHELLYAGEEHSRVDFAVYTRRLVDHVASLYPEKAGKILITTDVDKITMNIDTAVPVSLIVNELVSNSLRHAFPGDRTGNVDITMRMVGSRGYELVISDNGVGMDAPAASGDRPTLGLNLVASLADQLHGAVTWGAEEGTSFKVRFKEYQECDKLEL